MPEAPTFLTECGRTLHLTGLHYRPTYGDVLEGRPDDRHNRDIISRSNAMVSRIWPHPPIHLIPPAMIQVDGMHPILPPVHFWAWLVSYQPLRPRFVGSHLVVSWLQAELNGEPLEDIVGRAIQGLEWEELARDFIP